MVFKWINPIYRLARKCTGIKNFTKYQQTLTENGFRYRQALFDYVQERKNGTRKSQVPDGVDFLSLLLQNQDIFTDGMIVDELIDFFAAGVETVQFNTQTMVTCMIQSPESLKKVRDKF